MRKWILLYLLFFISKIMKGQDSTTINHSDIDGYSAVENDFSLGFLLAIPSQQMKPIVNNHLGDFGFGISLQILGDAGKIFGKDKSVIKLGGNLSYIFLGRFITQVTSSDELKTTYGLINLNAVTRLTRSSPEPIMPYLDLFGGACTYFARTKWHFANDDEPDLRNTMRFGLNRGLAGGVNFVTKGKDNNGWGLRFSYQWADQIRYVVRNTVQYIGNNSITYETDRASIAYGTASIIIRF